jgi:hypothetical protein
MNAMTQETWTLLENEFATFPIMKATPVDRQEIEAAAAELGVLFHDDYKEFVVRYGGAMVVPYPIFGLRKAGVMGNDSSVVAVTKKFRIDGWAGTSNWYIISVDGFGNPIGVSPDGKVLISDHDSGGIRNIASDFEDYLRKRCLTFNT